MLQTRNSAILGLLVVPVLLLSAAVLAADPREEPKLLLVAAETKLQLASLKTLLTRLETQQHASRADPAVPPSAGGEARARLEAKPTPPAEVSSSNVASAEPPPSAPVPPDPNLIEQRTPQKSAPITKSEPPPSAPVQPDPNIIKQRAPQKSAPITKSEPPPSAPVPPDPNIIKQRATQKSAALEQGLQIEFTDYGVYAVDRKIHGRDSLGINTATGSNIRHTATLRTIPAQIGTTFGFQFRIIGKPYDAPIDLRGVVKFPSPGMIVPSSTTPVPQDQFKIQTRIGEPAYFSYTIEDSFELVPGVWTMEIWHGDRRLGAQTFTLTN